MTRRSRARDVVRVREPGCRSPFFYVAGKGGGWFVSLLWNFGDAVDVPWEKLRRALASSKGDVVIARRLVGDEISLLAQARNEIEHEVHACVIHREALRWREPKRR